MSTEQKDAEQKDNVEPRTDDHHQVIDEPEERPPTPKPEVTDEHRAKAKEMARAINDDRPSVVMPGTGGAVSGTAVSDWIDEDGNPKADKGEG